VNEQGRRLHPWLIFLVGIVVGLALTITGSQAVSALFADLSDDHVSCMEQRPDADGRFRVAPEPDAGSGCTAGHLCVLHEDLRGVDRLTVTDCGPTE
jgi:hypothetical protein